MYTCMYKTYINIEKWKRENGLTSNLGQNSLVLQDFYNLLCNFLAVCTITTFGSGLINEVCSALSDHNLYFSILAYCISF